MGQKSNLGQGQNETSLLSQSVSLLHHMWFSDYDFWAQYWYYMLYRVGCSGKPPFSNKKQFVLERSARLNLDPGRGDSGLRGMGLVSPDDHVQEAGPSR